MPIGSASPTCVVAGRIHSEMELNAAIPHMNGRLRKCPSSRKLLEQAIRDGYRLATVKEASDNLEEVRVAFEGTSWYQDEYTHLYDGWMSRNKKPKQGYKGLRWDWMLVVKIGRYSLDEQYGEIKGPTEKQAALFFFTAESHKDQVEWLLKSTGDPAQFLAPDGRTLLHLAVAAGNEDILNLILDQVQNNTKDFVRKSDALGMTALLVAVKRGHEGIVNILLEKGAQPAEERDIDGKTALHYAAQLPDDEEDKAIKLSDLVLTKCFSEKCESYRNASNLGDECICKSLLLWAKASGIGTAEESAKSLKLRQYLSGRASELRATTPTENLLLTAARLENERMIGELLNRGYMNAKTFDFPAEEKKRVEKVRKQLDSISRSAADTPAEDDSLGREDFTRGLAALFLNPFIASPIVVGVSGEWGSGKSSVMIQTEKILLRTAAALAFPNLGVTRGVEANPALHQTHLSAKGEMVYKSMKSEAIRLLKFYKKEYRGDPVECILSENPSKFESYFKLLAVMDRSQMIQESKDQRSIDHPGVLTRAWQYIRCNPKTVKTLQNDGDQQKESESQLEDQALRAPPGILTIRYNAWRYRRESEAWAGLAVEITKEIEGRMTKAQQLSTRWRYSWSKNRSSIWLQLILPFIFIMILTPLVAWGAWVLMSRSKSKALEGFKYGCIPLSVILIVWNVMRTLIGIVKPVSEQISGYLFHSPDHAGNLGYQEQVIADIKFMKDEIGEKPSRLWMLVASCWNLSFYTRATSHVPDLEIRPASANKLKLIVFVDDLDRCQENVILEVLSAVNLVLAECKINVVLGMDKTMIERAINSKFGVAERGYRDTELEKLADKYLRKIVQIPLDLPDPSDSDLKKFLERHVGPSSESSPNDQSLVNQTNQQIHPPNHSRTQSDPSPAYHQNPSQPVQDDPSTCGWTLLLSTIKSVFARPGEKNAGDHFTVEISHTREWPRYVDDRTRSLGDVVNKCIFYRRAKEEGRKKGKGEIGINKQSEEGRRRREDVENDGQMDREEAEKQRQREKEKEKQRRRNTEELNNMEEVLSTYNNVSKESINAFQVFRFYCKPKHISFPPSKDSLLHGVDFDIFT
eukprot:Gb_34617 [translate_table: standard]